MGQNAKKPPSWSRRWLGEQVGRGLPPGPPWWGVRAPPSSVSEWTEQPVSNVTFASLGGAQGTFPLSRSLRACATCQHGPPRAGGKLARGGDGALPGAREGSRQGHFLFLLALRLKYNRPLDAELGRPDLRGCAVPGASRLGSGR